MNRNKPVASGRGQPGPIYDDAMKVLADDDLDAFLSLVGITDRATRLSAELAATKMHADLLAETSAGIVHVEFVKDPDPDLDIRMVNYRLRIRRHHRDPPITQYALVLRDITVPDHFDEVDTGQLSCTWTVVRVCDLDPAALLRHPTTAAIAALTRGTAVHRAAVLTAATELITKDTSPDRRDILLSAATNLASIVLPPDTIVTALKEATMPVPVRDTPLARLFIEEGEQKGLQKGLREGEQKGLREGERRAVLRMTRVMLSRRFGDDRRIDLVAARLADLTDEERLTRISTATSLDDLDL